MLKVLELFSGVGHTRQALKNIGIEHTATQCEIDKYAIDVYNQLHGQTPNLGDIAKVNPDDLHEGQFDLITYSSPCFVGDTLVMTSQGYKQIKDIKIGDLIITHTGKYKAVINVFDNGIKDILKIKGMGFDEIKCTPNHKFYVRKMKYRYVDKGKKTKEGWKSKTKEKYFDIPKWIEAKDLEKGCYLGIPLNNNEIIPIWRGVDYKWSDGRKNRHKNTLEKYMDNSYFWWIVGRFIGDGWLSDNGIKICTSHNELNEVTDVLDILNIHYCVIKERTVYKIQIASKEYMSFFSQFGRGSLNKHLTGIIFDLPCKLLKSFIEGYLSADGCNIKGIKKVTTVSRELAYGIAYCIMKAYHKPISLYKYKRENKYQIEKRIVNQHDTYQIRFNDYESPSNKAFYENGYIWLPFNKKEYYGKDNVYDIEIEDDHSFTAQNVIVHNCQDLSMSGLQKGFAKGSGTRSSLLWECEKIIRKVKPKYLLMENVKALVSDKFKPGFNKWLDILADMGYTSYYQILNAKDYTIPQNRERIFVVSILGQHNAYLFPQPVPLQKKLKDMLETDVEEKYYIKQEVSDKFIQKITNKQISNTVRVGGNGSVDRHSWDMIICAMRGRYTDKGTTQQQIEVGTDVANTITTIQKDNMVYEKKLRHIGNIDDKGKEGYRVYDSDGISSTIKAQGGGIGPNGLYKVEQIGNLFTSSTRDNPQRGRVYSTQGISPTLNTCQGGNLQPFCIEPINTEPDGTARTIKAQYAKNSKANFEKQGTFGATGVRNEYRIRKLTPREVWRLMGWQDEQFNKIKGISNAQLYKQAGNGIVIQVLETIFRQLFYTNSGIPAKQEMVQQELF